MGRARKNFAILKLSNAVLFILYRFDGGVSLKKIYESILSFVDAYKDIAPVGQAGKVKLSAGIYKTVTYLVNFGFVERVRRGTYLITEKGCISITKK